MKYILPILSIFVLLSACKKDDQIPNKQQPATSSNMYFPPNNSSQWNDTTAEELNWKTENIEPLYTYLSDNKTRAFIVLKDGKIVLEKYWGKNILNTSDFNQNTQWYWASAGKTLTSMLVGIAQAEGILSIEDKTSKYLGTGWTSIPLANEDKILIRHQLSMNYTVDNTDCLAPECLQYKANAGQQWYYHNAPYTLLDKVIANASGQDYNAFTNQKVGDKIGMQGKWIPLDELNVFWSSARDAARFGLLLLNKGNWDNNVIINDSVYFKNMTQSSQNLNPSYGYLTWLNGKSSIVMPGSANSYNVSLAANAPADLFAAMGKNGQFIDVVPSENLVVVRFGEAPDNSLVPAIFHNEMWAKIMDLIP